MRSFRILTPYETELADAMFEAMFPSDGHSPDVREAGVNANRGVVAAFFVQRAFGSLHGR